MNCVMLSGTVVEMTEPKSFRSGGILSTIDLALGDAEENHVKVQLWNDVSKWCRKHVREGDEIMVAGRARTSEWLDKETGEERYRLVIEATEIVPERAMLRPDNRKLRDRYFGDDD